MNKLIVFLFIVIGVISFEHANAVTITNTYPANFQIGVALNDTIKIVFDNAVDTSRYLPYAFIDSIDIANNKNIPFYIIPKSKFDIYGNKYNYQRQPIARGNFSYDSNIVRFIPEINELDFETEYVIICTMLDSIQSLANKITFTTIQDVYKITDVSQNLKDGLIRKNDSILITYNRNFNTTQVNELLSRNFIVIEKISNETIQENGISRTLTPISFSLACSNNILKIKPSLPFEMNANYSIRFNNNLLTGVESDIRQYLFSTLNKVIVQLESKFIGANRPDSDEINSHNLSLTRKIYEIDQKITIEVPVSTNDYYFDKWESNYPNLLLQNDSNRVNQLSFSIDENNIIPEILLTAVYSEYKYDTIYTKPSKCFNTIYEGESVKQIDERTYSIKRDPTKIINIYLRTIDGSIPDISRFNGWSFYDHQNNTDLNPMQFIQSVPITTIIPEYRNLPFKELMQKGHDFHNGLGEGSCFDEPEPPVCSEYYLTVTVEPINEWYESNYGFGDIDKDNYLPPSKSAMPRDNNHKLSNMVIFEANSVIKYNANINDNEPISWDRVQGRTIFTSPTPTFDFSVRLKDEYINQWEIQYVYINGNSPAKNSSTDYYVPHLWYEDKLNKMLGSAWSSTITAYPYTCKASITIGLRKKVCTLDVNLAWRNFENPPNNEWTVRIENRQPLGAIKNYGMHKITLTNTSKQYKYYLWQNYSIDICPGVKPLQPTNRWVNDGVYDFGNYINNEKDNMRIFLDGNKNTRYEYDDPFRLDYIRVKMVDRSGKVEAWQQLSPSDVNFKEMLSLIEDKKLNFDLIFNKNVDFQSISSLLGFADKDGLRPGGKEIGQRLDLQPLINYRTNNLFSIYPTTQQNVVNVELRGVDWGNTIMLQLDGIRSQDGDFISPNTSASITTVGPKLQVILDKVELTKHFDPKLINYISEVHAYFKGGAYNHINKVADKLIQEINYRFPSGENTTYPFEFSFWDYNPHKPYSVFENVFFSDHYITSRQYQWDLSITAFENDNDNLDSISKIINTGIKTIGELFPSISTFTNLLSKFNDSVLDLLKKGGIGEKTDHIGGTVKYFTYNTQWYTLGHTQSDVGLWGISNTNDRNSSLKVRIGSYFNVWLKINYSEQ